MLSRITGHSVCVEVRRATTSFDVVRHIRVMRLRWLAELLRDDKLHTRYIYTISCSALALHTYPDRLLSDAPPHANLEHLASLTKDKAYWKEHVENI